MPGGMELDLVDPALRKSLQLELGYKCLARVECGTNGNVTPGLLLERSSKLHADRQQGGDATTVGGVLYIKCLADCCAARPLGLHSMGGSIYSGNAFEAHAGRSYRKKWRETIRVLPQGISLKAWLSSVGREYGAAEYAKHSSPRTKEELVEAALAAVAAAASAMASESSAASHYSGGDPGLRPGLDESPALQSPLLKGLWGGLPHPQQQHAQSAALATLLSAARPPLLAGPHKEPQQPQPGMDLGRNSEQLPLPTMPEGEALTAVSGQLRGAASAFPASSPVAAGSADMSRSLSGSRSSGSLLQGLHIQQQQQRQRQQPPMSRPTPQRASPACDAPQQLPLLQVVAALHSLSSDEQRLQDQGNASTGGVAAPPACVLHDTLAAVPNTNARTLADWSPADNDAVMVAVVKHIQSQAEQVQQLRELAAVQQQRIQQQEAQLLQQAQRLDAQSVEAQHAAQQAARQTAVQLELQHTADVLRAGIAALFSSQLPQAGSTAAAQQPAAERPAASDSGAPGMPCVSADRHAVNDETASRLPGPAAPSPPHAAQHQHASQPRQPPAVAADLSCGNQGPAQSSDQFAGWLAEVAAAAALDNGQSRQAASKRPREDGIAGGTGSGGSCDDARLAKRSVAN
ncbi:hypothetical protein D9Q98_006382 [Chlorella vulgaris]|uniref:SAND domain-containing protein n=1 Tax=Chlorella vulgaris TaxID=3077 RepID=A0A9D4YV55_CHLVU|nr:hypothetical protein D9Q98_006382 [Chlorella vulgaris]